MSKSRQQIESELRMAQHHIEVMIGKRVSTAELQHYFDKRLLELKDSMITGRFENYGVEEVQTALGILKEGLVPNLMQRLGQPHGQEVCQVQSQEVCQPEIKECAKVENKNHAKLADKVHANIADKNRAKPPNKKRAKVPVKKRAN